MAAMMLMLNRALLKFISINITTAISWLPPLISQFFHPSFLRLHHFFTAWLLLYGSRHTVVCRAAQEAGA